MLMKLDMTNHHDSLMLTIITVFGYIVDYLLRLWGFIKIPIIDPGIVGLAVLLSALSTGVLNLYKFWLMWKERNKKSSNKTIP